MRKVLLYLIFISVLFHQFYGSQLDESSIPKTDSQTQAQKRIICSSETRTDDENEPIQSYPIEKSECETPFIPTTEWQAVLKGQAIPPGLHVRMNLETGEVEAKLMEGSVKSEIDRNHEVVQVERKKKNEDLVLVPQEDEPQPTLITKERLKELEEIWDYLTQMVNKEVNEMFENLEIIKNNLETKEAILESFQVIETIVHHYDYAKDFTSAGGMNLMWEICKSSNDTQMRIASLSVIGSAVQSNPEIQIYCLEKLNILDEIKDMLNTNYEIELRRKILFVLSTISRGTRKGRESFLENDYFSLLASQYEREPDEKFRKKCMTIVTDFMNEMQDFGAQGSIPSIQNNWCSFFLEQLLSDNMDTIEKGLEAILVSLKNSFCIYETSKLEHSLSKSEEFIKRLNDDMEEYKEILSQKILAIRNTQS